MSHSASADNANPRDWRSYVEELRQQGLLNDDHEQALQRFFSERENLLGHRMQAISTEYERRVAEDGDEPARAWLTAQARAMGQSDREEIEQLLTRIVLPLPERGSPAVDAVPSQANPPGNDPAQPDDSAETPDARSNIAFHEPEPGQDADAHLRRPRQRPRR